MVECGHGGICYDCAIRMLKIHAVCPFCRKKATAVYKVEGTDRASIMQASDAAVFVMPGQDKNRARENVINMADVSGRSDHRSEQQDAQQGHS